MEGSTKGYSKQSVLFIYRVSERLAYESQALAREDLGVRWSFGGRHLDSRAVFRTCWEMNPRNMQTD